MGTKECPQREDCCAALCFGTVDLRQGGIDGDIGHRWKDLGHLESRCVDIPEWILITKTAIESCLPFGIEILVIGT
jgi:hypothetical protein